MHAVFSMGDEAELEALLGDAGFGDVDVRAEVRDLALPGARDFLWQYVGSTPLAGAVAGADRQARSALEDEVVTEWSRFEEADGMSYRQRILTASARSADRD